MKKYFIAENLPTEGGFLFDTVWLRQMLKRLPEAEQKAAAEKLDEYEQRPLKMAFGFCVFAKRDCGCWELLQVPKYAVEYDDETMQENYCKGKCTRCTCNW